MSNYTFEEIIDEVYRREYSEFDNAPKHRFSLRHRLRMRQIFRLFRKNTKRLDMPRFKLTRRTAVAMLLIIILAVFSACASMLVIGDFVGEKHEDNTQLFAKNIDGAPTSIEDIYVLTEIPEGFVCTTDILGSTTHYVIYTNDITGAIISFVQSTKIEFDTHYNTEGYWFEEVDINGHTGLYIEFDVNDTLLVWDNDDYILELSCNLPKSDIVKLAKSAKL